MAEHGVIVKGIAGFYYVDTGDHVYQCKARGIFRKKDMTPLVGDRVTISVLPDGEAVVETIEPRRNAFIRPPVANVECLVLVLAAADPDPSPLVADRFLVMAEEKGAEVLICINKMDLLEGKRSELLDIYGDLYPVFPVCAATGQGMDALRQAISGKIAALSGPSGVGKSTILNAIMGKDLAETGEISQKLGRGKNTTRHAELFALEGGGHIFDTPGFTSFDLEALKQGGGKRGEASMEEQDLAHYYPEMAALLGDCRYDNCRHLSEPDCCIREAVEAGKIHPSRYESYCVQMEELKNRKKY